MTEIEVPTDHLHEHIQQEAEHNGGWVSQVALSSALIAVLAAVGALIAGDRANEAMIQQIQSSNSWNHYQAKSIKAAVLGNKIDMLNTFAKPVNAKDLEKSEEYKKEMAEIYEQAKEKEQSSKKNLASEEVLSRSVTLFQISIAISAIAVLSRRKKFWYVSLGFGALGAVSLVQGILF